MKRMHLVIIAIVMAVGFSAFTPESKPLGTVYYNLGSGWVPTNNPCPEGDTHPCQINIGGQSDVQLYRSMSFDLPVTFD